MRFRTVILVMVILLAAFPAEAAVEVGGETSVTMGRTFYGGEPGNDIFGIDTDLELFLPRFQNNEFKVELNIYQDLLKGEIDYYFKKMYWEHRFEKFHLTAGRQPVSWSFGSLLNPVDYNPGAVVMDRETGGKYLNAVTGYIPLDWNSGLTLVAGFPKAGDEIKWGFRGRKGIGGYDVSLNLIREPEKEINGIVNPATNRAGISAKGDLGPAGIYGAISFSKNEKDAYSTYLLGTDYSHRYNYGTNTLLLQFEYMNTEGKELNNFAGGMIPMLPEFNERLNLILGNINYSLNDFSSISFMTASCLNDSSFIVVPSYQNQINSNLELILRGSINEGNTNSLFKPGEKTTAGVEIVLNYAF